MKIGIIGAGFIGRALATHAINAGHDVMLSNSRGPQTLLSTAIALGCKIGSAHDAASFGDMVFVAIPFNAYQSVPVAPLAGKIVVDANNYYWQRDGRIAVLDTHDTTTCELLAAHLPDAKVIKAFNAILQGDLERGGTPAGTPGRRALPIAGDDADAKSQVAALIDVFGFDVVDAGALSEGWRFERAKPAYCAQLDAQQLTAALAAAQVGVDVADGSWRV
ncbi:MAG: NAD(P)-binding domain-containing protein [Pseudomonadota bacterium]